MAPSAPMSKAAGAYSAPAATSTAAMPTSEWKAATSSGIEVIGTRRAITAPVPPPTAMPAITRPQEIESAGGCDPSVVSTAIAMPIIPRRLPSRLDTGLDSPRSAWMNRTPATRYSNATRFGLIRRSFLFLLIHRQHALGDQEAAEDIDRREAERNEAERARPERTAVVANERDTDREQGADDDHRGDGVGHRHQWRVQRRRHRPHHVVADEHRQHENRKAE